MKTKVFLVLLFGSPAISWAERPATPEEVALFQRAIQPPGFAYQGRVTVTHWNGARATTEDVNVSFQPPNSYRWEFLKPNGDVDRIHVRRGDDERLQISQKSARLHGKSSQSSPKQITKDQEWTLLNRNYRILNVGEEMIAGEKAVVIELAPQTGEKPKQQFWIDRDDQLVLAIKRFRDKGQLAVSSRFTRFEKKPHLSETEFSLSDDSTTATEDHGYDPHFLSLADLERQTGRASSLPARLPLGFEFESADTFQADSHNALHYRYTDGMVVLSIFQTTKPARFSRVGRGSAAVAPPPVGPFDVSDAGHVLHTKRKDGYFTLISDVSEDTLQTIAQSLK